MSWMWHACGWRAQVEEMARWSPAPGVVKCGVMDKENDTSIKRRDPLDGTPRRGPQRRWRTVACAVDLGSGEARCLAAGAEVGGAMR